MALVVVSFVFGKNPFSSELVGLGLIKGLERSALRHPIDWQTIYTLHTVIHPDQMAKQSILKAVSDSVGGVPPRDPCVQHDETLKVETLKNRCVNFSNINF